LRRGYFLKQYNRQLAN